MGGPTLQAYAAGASLGEGRLNILLVDDHALFRGGLKFLLQQLDTGLVLDEAGNCAQAIERASDRRYDLILLDLNMPGLNRLDALQALREAAPDAPVVVLSGEGDPAVVRAAIDAGAMGFIPKSATPEVLIQALRLVLAHGVYLPVEVLNAAEASPPLQQSRGAKGAEAAEAASGVLTARQMEVLRCVIQGKPNKVIARELGVAESTIKVHLSSVLRAFGARNRTEAVYGAAKMGLRLV
jgi:DNA-binding NarL/FixJ family response regulator